MTLNRQRISESGFSLIELLIVVALVGILSSVAFPSLRTWKQNSDLNADMRRLYAFFQKTRLEAVKRNTDCSIAFNQVVNGTAFDYVSFIDADANNVYDDGEETIHTGLFATGVTADPATYTGSFDRRGLIDANKTINVSSVNGSQHSLIINVRGKMRIQ